jgi:bifunctional enzyme CysN/CysC
MIVRKKSLPLVNSRFEAILCWMYEEPMDRSARYVLMHTTRQTQAYISDLVYRIDVDTLHREQASTLGLNDIGRVEITSSQPVFFDPYDSNRETGSFILIHPHTHVTVAAGMIRGEVRTAEAVLQTERQERLKSPHVVWEKWNIQREEREQKNGHQAAVLWFTGLSGSGKSTIARTLERRLFEEGVKTMLLDGDQVRHGLCADLGFSSEDRAENIRRVGEVAKLFFEKGCVVLCTFISPFQQDRDRVRGLVPEGRFLEIFVDTPLEVCQARDTKGLYAKAERGEITHFTGVSSPYEAPAEPEVRLQTVNRSQDEITDDLLARLQRLGIISQPR